MGQVYLGVSPGGRRVAVKLIHPIHAGAAQFRERFAREIEAAQRVGGFHTALVVDADPMADPPWMVTAYIDGPSLQEAVSLDGPLTRERVRALGAGLAEGLGAIHARGLIHRDLKPSNVILASDGPRIIDFGIARAVDATTGLTTTGTVVGTVAYMSPEQIRGETVGPASDVFALGCILTFAAIGRPPFGDDSAVTVIFRVINQPPDLVGLADERLAELISACLAKGSTDRPAIPDLLTAFSSSRQEPIAAAIPVVVVPMGGKKAVATQTHVPVRTETNPRSEAFSSLVPPHTSGSSKPSAPIRTGRARQTGGRRRAALLAIGVVTAVLAVMLPILLGTGLLRSVSGHEPSGKSSANVTIPERELTVHAPHTVGITGVSFSADGKLVADSSGNGYVYVWSVATGKLTKTLTNPGNGTGTAAFSPDGTLLATATGLNSNNRVYLWDVAADKLIRTLTNPRPSGIDAVGFSPDGKLLAVGNGEHACVWELATSKLALNLNTASVIDGVAFSPDGKLLAAAGGTSKGPVFVWDVATGKRLATLYGPNTFAYGVHGVAFSPDGKLLVAGGGDGSIYLWNVATDSLIATLPSSSRGSQLAWVAISPDGRLVAGADWGNNHAYLWDVVTHKLVGTFTDPGGSQVWSVAFNPDGKLLAAADGMGNIYVRRISQLVS
jgi:serine/threonine protein kinase/DNA-binding beta-propeller fold protein YncE